MPPTTLRLTFLQNLKNKQTNATLTLDKITGAKAAILNDLELWRQLREENSLRAPLGDPGRNDKIKEWLENNGFKPKDIDHVDKWPNTTPTWEGRFGKEAVRKMIVYAINNDVNLKFKWYLHRSDKTRIVFTPDGDPPSEVEITFLNPFEKLDIKETTDDVEVIIDEPQDS